MMIGNMMIPNQLSSHYGDLTVLVNKEYWFQQVRPYGKREQLLNFLLKYATSCFTCSAGVLFFSTLLPFPALSTSEEGNIIYQTS